ncbi:MAG: DUF4178 domain-containing protein [Azoarcus sp.]|nr:DUF4178 domain-containing protein [Azoarcus sp.]
MRLRSAVSVLAVCEYCRATLLDLDGKIENLGKMAELAEDRSRLRVDAQGVYGGRCFTVVGRIQLQYEAGLWNEWFLLFDDAGAGWLSEAGGAYALTFPCASPTGSPAFSAVRPGNEFVLAGTAWTVSNVERAVCVAGEGELPFRVGGGYPAPVVDLRAGKRLATLDYSDDAANPLFFVGEAVDFASLQWRNLREDIPGFTGATGRAKGLNCAQCGAPLELKHEGVLSIGCAHCGAITDTETEKLISRIEASRKVEPLIPIGEIGMFRGEKLEVIGFMARHSLEEGEREDWHEYLLARVGKPGYRWLTCYNTRWSLVDVLEELPARAGAAVVCRGQKFERSASYTGYVDYVLGEFTWRVRVGEEVFITDYVSLSSTLSAERTGKEITWSLAEPIPARDVKAAFSRARIEVGLGGQRSAAQGGARYRPMWLHFGVLAAILALLQVIFVLSFGNARDLASVDMPLIPSADFTTSLSKPFSLDHSASLEVDIRAEALDDDWIELGISLVEEDSGRSTPRQKVTLSRYATLDGAAEVSRLVRRAVFDSVPAGHWRLVVERIGGAASLKVAYSDIRSTSSLAVRRRGVLWSNFFACLFVLAAWPLAVLARWRVW